MKNLKNSKNDKNTDKKLIISDVSESYSLVDEMVKKFPFIKEAKGYLTIKTELNEEQKKNLEEFKQAWRNNFS